MSEISFEKVSALYKHILLYKSPLTPFVQKGTVSTISVSLFSVQFRLWVTAFNNKIAGLWGRKGYNHTVNKKMFSLY